MAESWFKRLARNPESLGKGMAGASAMMVSLMHDIESIDEFKRTGIAQVLTNIDKHRSDLPSGLMDAMAPINAQAIPVMMMDAMVHATFFISRLANELKSAPTISELAWERIVPIGNRSIGRMVTVASMTLTIVDTADAAFCAAVESTGNEIAFAQRFVAHYNYVAAGRCVIAIVREAEDEATERRLLREKRELTERHSELVVSRLEQYKKDLQTRLDAYLSEDLEAFLGGLSMMDEGLVTGDSNLVISGNVQIQQALGRETTFTNQEEFDLLMESDEDFVL